MDNPTVTGCRNNNYLAMFAIAYARLVKTYPLKTDALVDTVDLYCRKPSVHNAAIQDADPTQSRGAPARSA